MSNKPVVFIPGYIGTELRYRPENWTIFPPAPLDLLDSNKKRRLVALLADPKFDDPTDDVVPVEPIRTILGIAKQAAALYDLLDSLDYDTSGDGPDFRAVAWDWRKAVDDRVTQAAVAQAIDELSANDRKVVVIPHSAGGLVLRKLLESRPELARKIDEVLAFGVPWCGAADALLGLFEPERVGFGPLSLSSSEVRQVTRHAQATYDLCPLNPATSDLARVNLFVENGQPAAPLLRTSWMDEPFMLPLAAKADQRMGSQQPEITLGGGFAMPPVTNVAGWGAKTIAQCDLNADHTLTFSDSPFQLGDGTVPLASAGWIRGPRVRTMYVPIGAYPVANLPMRHSRIWDSPPVLQLLREVLQDAAREPFIAASVDANDFQDPGKSTVKLRISAADANGNALPDCVATLRFGAGNNPVVALNTVRKDVEVTRTHLAPNATADLFRLPIDIRWRGGSTQRVVVFHTA